MMTEVVNVTAINQNNATIFPSLSSLSPEDHYKIGAALAVTGNVIIAVSLNVQKYAHRKRELESTTNIPVSSDKSSLCAPGSYLRSGTWWVGILLMILGEIGNFVAYGFAPASVVAPLGCVAVLANGVLAVFFNKESLRMQDVMGASFAVVGGFLIIQFSNQTDAIMSAQQIVEHLGGWQFIIYMFVEVIIYGLIIFLRSYKHYQHHGVLLHLTLVAILGSFTVISAKAVSGMLALTFEGTSQLVYPIFYIMLVVMLVTTLLQVKYLNQAMANFDIATVVPVNFVFFTISAILAGAIFYQEFFNRSGITIVMFLFGCMLSFSGVMFLTSEKSKPVHDETTLHLDMMPNFIRALASSMKALNVQPEANSQQVISYPDDSDTDPRASLLPKDDADRLRTRYSVSADKVTLDGLAAGNLSSPAQGVDTPEASDDEIDYTDWDVTTDDDVLAVSDKKPPL